MHISGNKGAVYNSVQVQVGTPPNIVADNVVPPPEKTHLVVIIDVLVDQEVPLYISVHVAAELGG